MYGSTFCTVKPNSSSPCYTEREDVVRCWNAASSRVKISILETANIGSCVLLNPVAPCKAGGRLSRSALHHRTRQSRARTLTLKSNSMVNCVSLLLMDNLPSGYSLLSRTWASSGRLPVCVGWARGWQVSQQAVQRVESQCQARAHPVSFTGIGATREKQRREFWGGVWPTATQLEAEDDGFLAVRWAPDFSSAGSYSVCLSWGCPLLHVPHLQRDMSIMLRITSPVGKGDHHQVCDTGNAALETSALVLFCAGGMQRRFVQRRPAISQAWEAAGWANGENGSSGKLLFCEVRS